MARKTVADYDEQIARMQKRMTQLREERRDARVREQKERKEREYQERVQNALEFYDHKELFEHCYELCELSKLINLQNSEMTFYDYFESELQRSGKKFDWRDEEAAR